MPKIIYRVPVRRAVRIEVYIAQKIVVEISHRLYYKIVHARMVLLAAVYFDKNFRQQTFDFFDVIRVLFGIFVGYLGKQRLYSRRSDYIFVQFRHKRLFGRVENERKKAGIFRMVFIVQFIRRKYYAGIRFKINSFFRHVFLERRQIMRRFRRVNLALRVYILFLILAITFAENVISKLVRRMEMRRDFLLIQIIYYHIFQMQHTSPLTVYNNNDFSESFKNFNSFRQIDAVFSFETASCRFDINI